MVINIFNVYGPLFSSGKKVLWTNLKRVGLSTEGPPSIFLGDFNCTRLPNDRLSCNFNVRDAKLFIDWIKQLNLVELSLTNTKFTWIGPNNRKKRNR